MLARIAAAQAARRAVALATRLADGRQSLVGDADPAGDLPLDAAAAAETQERLAAGHSGILEADPGVFLRVYSPSPRLLIVGAVHIAQTLAPMATMAGFDVVIVDPRLAFATPDRFPGVALAVEWPDEAMARLAPDALTAVVLLSHDPKLDDPALHAALASPAFYIGALGSRRTHEKRLARLEDAGLRHLAGRIHGPVGLDLGGRSPAEIAVSILAQIIQVRYRGMG